MNPLSELESPPSHDSVMSESQYYLTLTVINTLMRVFALKVTSAYDQNYQDDLLTEGGVLATAPHTSHLDAVVVWKAASKEVRKNFIPVVKGTYWSHPLMHGILSSLFPIFITVQNENQDIRDILGPLEQLLQRFPHALLFILTQGTRNMNANVDPGAFLLSEVFQLPVIPVNIESSGELLPKEKNKLDMITKSVSMILKGIPKTVLGRRTRVEVTFFPELELETDAEKIPVAELKERKFRAAVKQALIKMKKYITVLRRHYRNKNKNQSEVPKPFQSGD